MGNELLICHLQTPQCKVRFTNANDLLVSFDTKVNNGSQYTLDHDKSNESLVGCNGRSISLS